VFQRRAEAPAMSSASALAEAGPRLMITGWSPASPGRRSPVSFIPDYLLPDGHKTWLASSVAALLHGTGWPTWSPLGPWCSATDGRRAKS